MRKLSLFFLALSLCGCAHYPVNPPLKSYSPDYGYRPKNLKSDGNSDSLFVVLAFSGGGTRAAALSYGVLKALKDTPIVWEGKKKSLLDEVDLISSISGGSFTAAYYKLFGDRIFSDFEAKFLKRDIQKELFHGLFKPWNAVRLASPYFDRIDMAAELYDKTVFDGKSFADLQADLKKPFLVINATDLYLGDRFEFTQEQFDFMGSDLAPVKIGRAVAASSAFPFLLSPVTFRDYGGDPSLAKQAWISDALEDYQLNRRRYMRAKDIQVYLDGRDHPYIHLMDGGLADNIGIRHFIDSVRDADPEDGIRRLMNEGKIKKLAVIIVNAKTDKPEDMDKKESAPDLTKVAAKTATTSMDNYSFESVETVRDLAEQRTQARKAIADCQEKLDQVAPGKLKLPQLPGIQFYVIEVNFESLPDPKERESFLSLPTSFALKPEQVDALVAVGPRLLRDSEEFQQLIKDLK